MEGKMDGGIDRELDKRDG
jgi:hypothetical protein